jgi:hypothetical protein
MSLSDLASLGSFVSGCAVLISLVYLSLQVRQTKRNQQIAIRHSRASRIVELHLALGDSGVADAWLHGSARPEEITQTEVGQYVNLCRALFFHFEDSFYQREEGLLNDDAFETVVAGVRLSARSPGWRAAWRLARPNFGGRFLDFMDRAIAGAAAGSLPGCVEGYLCVRGLADGIARQPLAAALRLILAAWPSPSRTSSPVARTSPRETASARPGPCARPSPIRCRA